MGYLLEANSKTISCIRVLHFFYIFIMQQFLWLVSIACFHQLKREKYLTSKGKSPVFHFFNAATLNRRELCRLFNIWFIYFSLLKLFSSCLFFLNCSNILLSLNILKSMHIDLVLIKYFWKSRWLFYLPK